MENNLESEYDEKELLSLIAQGDETAFKVVYDQYAPSLYGAALKHFKEQNISEDFVKEIFEHIWLNRKKIIHSESFNFYLQTMVEQLSPKYFKKMASKGLASSKAEPRPHISDQFWINETGKLSNNLDVAPE
jgi:DNA-directed RNA polymerase specialized sigma24 family protein